MVNYLQQLTTEEKLLLSLCRLHFTDDQKREIGNLMKRVTGWDKFVTLSNEHGVISLSWYNIVETGNKDFIPSEYLGKLHSGYLKSLARNTRIFDLLKEVLELAEKENIKIVLLKGLALEQTIYGNRGLRQMNDIDILVRQDSAIRLRKKLLAIGFVSIPIISPLHEKVMPAYGKHLPEMIKKGLSVEIHFRLFDQPGNSLTERLFNEAKLQALDSSDFEIYIPDTLLFFLHLVKHLDKHEKIGTSQLRLYLDLVVLLLEQRREIGSKEFLKLAETAGLNYPLIEKLYILRLFWNISFPAWIEKQFEKFDKVKISERFLHFLRHPSGNEPEKEPDSLLKPLENIPEVINKFLFIMGYLFPSLTFMQFRYKTKDRFIAIAFYPVRWFKLLKLLFSGKFFLLP
jgi:hypothetical protein